MSAATSSNAPGFATEPPRHPEPLNHKQTLFREDSATRTWRGPSFLASLGPGSRRHLGHDLSSWGPFVLLSNRPPSGPLCGACPRRGRMVDFAPSRNPTVGTAPRAVRPRVKNPRRNPPPRNPHQQLNPFALCATRRSFGKPRKLFLFGHRVGRSVPAKGALFLLPRIRTKAHPRRLRRSVRLREKARPLFEAPFRLPPVTTGTRG